MSKFKTMVKKDIELCMKKDKKFKIFNEILNDAFWLSYILEIKEV